MARVPCVRGAIGRGARRGGGTVRVKIDREMIGQIREESPKKSGAARVGLPGNRVKAGDRLNVPAILRARSGAELLMVDRIKDCERLPNGNLSHALFFTGGENSLFSPKPTSIRSAPHARAAHRTPQRRQSVFEKTRRLIIF